MKMQGEIATAWDARLWAMWYLLPNRRPCSGGTDELIATKFDGSKYRESVGHKIITLNIIAGSVDSEHEPLIAEGTARVTVTENML